jgi:hypothetical protein
MTRERLTTVGPVNDFSYDDFDHMTSRSTFVYCFVLIQSHYIDFLEESCLLM